MPIDRRQPLRDWLDALVHDEGRRDREGGDLFAAARLRLRLTVSDMSRRLGVREQYLYKVETGRIHAAAELVGRLRRLLPAREGDNPVPDTTPVKWTAALDKLHGRMPDAAVGRIAGCSGESARRRRVALGIAAYRPERPWTEAELALLGTVPDPGAARRLKRSPVAVRIMRHRQGVPPFTPGRPRRQTQ